MARGGKRPGAGRPKGAANKRTREVADKAAQDGITPLEYMLDVMRDVSADRSERMDAAKAAAPYIHPRLSTVEHTGDADKRVAVTMIELVAGEGTS